MKVALPVLMAAAGLLAVPACAQDAAASPFFGTWAVDVASLAVPPEARPQSVTFTFSPAGEGLWKTRLDVVDADGSAKTSEMTHHLDGSTAHIDGNVGPDTAAVTGLSPDVLVMALSGQGVPYSMRVYSVAPDGESQTETAVYYTREGVPVIRQTRLNRVR